MMGVGKSTVGKAVADKLSMNLLMLIKSLKKRKFGVNEIFTKKLKIILEI